LPGKETTYKITINVTRQLSSGLPAATCSKKNYENRKNYGGSQAKVNPPLVQEKRAHGPGVDPDPSSEKNDFLKNQARSKRPGGSLDTL